MTRHHDWPIGRHLVCPAAQLAERDVHCIRERPLGDLVGFAHIQKKDLLAAIEQGLARDRAWRAQREEVAALQSRFLKLTAREREVMDLVVSGMPNKQIAAQLNLSEITVKLHRSRVMQKTQVDSLAELVRITERLRAIVPP